MDDLGAMFNDASDSATQVAQPAVENVPAETKAEVAEPQNTQVSTGVEDSFSLSMPASMRSKLEESGVVVGEIGTKISRVPIEKYKASSNKVDRISILTSEVMAIKFHYVDGVGSVLCFGGKCCQVAGTPQIRYLFPIAVYSTDVEGNVTGSKVEMKILSAGEDLYKNITTISHGCSQYGGIDHCDLLVTCTDDKYQKIALTFCGEALWRKSKKIADFLSEKWSKDAENAYMAVARKVDESTFLKLAGIESEQESSYPEEIKEQDLANFFKD